MSAPTYIQRNVLLQQLGYSSYTHYLAGELWAEIRHAVLERDNHSCRLCKTRTGVVHHLDYSKATLTGETFNGLVAICRKCHEKVEFNKKGEKYTLAQSVIAYRRRERLWLGHKKQRTKCKKQRKVLTRCSICKKNWAGKRKLVCIPCQKRQK